MPAALTRQIVLFLIVGAAQVVLDWAVFVGLTAAGLPLVAGNLAGRLAGASVGYWLNGRHTFASDNRIRLSGAHLRRFVVAWLLMTALSTFLLADVARHFDLRAAWLAKPAVEALMAGIGFVVWRQWVFR